MKVTTLCYIEKDNKYLMLLRNAKKLDGSAGKWLGVGGKLKAGETPEECIQREVLEETGLTLTSFRRRGIIRYYSDTWSDEEMYLYSADAFTGELNETCDEGELQWISLDEIMALNLWEGDRIFLRRLMDGDENINMSLTYEGDQLVGCEFHNADFSEEQ